MNIDPDIQAHIPPLREDERATLEQRLLSEGCRDPLVVWSGVLLDGHHRYAICEEHGISYSVHEIELPDRDAAIAWIEDNQLGRRNLTPDQFRLFLGKKYKREKREQGGTGANQHLQTGQNDHSATAKRLAAQHGTSERTVRRSEHFAEKVDSDPELRRTVMDGGSTRSKKTHVSNNSGNNEWYTPAHILEAARNALGGFDLDPASSEKANETVQAGRYYTADDDGLSQPWSGRVWLNPPYAQPAIADFATAAVEAHAAGNIEAACVLTNNATETAWLQRLFGAASAVCFLRGRVKYLNSEGEPENTPLQGQCVTYLGPDPQTFAEAFADLGRVWLDG